MLKSREGDARGLETASDKAFICSSDKSSPLASFRCKNFRRACFLFEVIVPPGCAFLEPYPAIETRDISEMFETNDHHLGAKFGFFGQLGIGGAFFKVDFFRFAKLTISLSPAAGFAFTADKFATPFLGAVTAGALLFRLTTLVAILYTVTHSEVPNSR